MCSFCFAGLVKNHFSAVTGGGLIESILYSKGQDINDAKQVIFFEPLKSHTDILHLHLAQAETSWIQQITRHLAHRQSGRAGAEEDTPFRLRHTGSDREVGPDWLLEIPAQTGACRSEATRPEKNDQDG